MSDVTGPSESTDGGLSGLWSRFRTLPGWGQGIACVIAWPLLGALFFAQWDRLGRLGLPVAIIFAIIFAPVWFMLPFVEPEDAPEQVAIDEEPEEEPEQDPTRAPEPEEEPEPTPEPEPEAEDEEPDLPEFHVAEIEDTSFPGAVRFGIHVVVEEGTTVAQLRELSPRLTAWFREQQGDYQALVIGYYDYEQLIGYGYVLGKWEHVPFGDWGRANEVDLGDYDDFEHVPDLREKPWDQRPTQQQVEMYDDWWEATMRIEDEAWDRGEDPDYDEVEQQAAEEVGEDYGVSADEVLEAASSVGTWIFASAD